MYYYDCYNWWFSTTAKNIYKSSTAWALLTRILFWMRGLRYLSLRKNHIRIFCAFLPSPTWPTPSFPYCALFSSLTRPTLSFIIKIFLSRRIFFNGNASRKNFRQEIINKHQYIYINFKKTNGAINHCN